MSQVIAIAAGGAIGALLRYWVSISVHALLGRGFPYGTLAVNLIGSLLMGYLFVLFLERLAFDGVWRAGILIGLLGVPFGAPGNGCFAATTDTGNLTGFDCTLPIPQPGTVDWIGFNTPGFTPCSSGTTPCVPTSVEQSSWGSIKGLYR